MLAVPLGGKAGMMGGYPRVTIGFIGGAGMMGGAMIRGLVKAGMYKAENICFTEISDERSAALLSDVPGVHRMNNTKALGQASDIIVIAVEPKDTPAVCAELCTVDAMHDRIIVSLAAGITMASLAEWTSSECRIARVMPNTPCVVGEMAAGEIVAGQYPAAGGATRWAGG